MEKHVLPYEMMGSLAVSENIVHIGALLYLAGFLFQNAMILRSLIILGDCVYILYFYFAPEVPLWGGIFWSVMFSIVNFVMIALIVVDRVHFGLDANERKLFEMLEDLTPGQFRQLLKAGRQETAIEQKVIAHEHKPLTDLYFVLAGTMTIEKAGNRATAPSGTFIGEIAFLLARPATATVTLAPGSPYFVWNGAKLRQLMQKQPALGTAMSAVLNKMLAQKVATAGVIMNTIGIEAPVAPAATA